MVYGAVVNCIIKGSQVYAQRVINSVKQAGRGGKKASIGKTAFSEKKRSPMLRAHAVDSTYSDSVKGMESARAFCLVHHLGLFKRRDCHHRNGRTAQYDMRTIDGMGT